MTTINKLIESKRTRALLLISSYALILLAVRTGWGYYHTTRNQPNLVEGQVNLSNWDFLNKNVTLNGEWLFFPDQFIVEPNLTAADQHQTAIVVPGNWEGALQFRPHSDTTNYGYGTYYLKVQLPEQLTDRYYGFKFDRITSAAAIYVNGELLTIINQPAERPGQVSYREGAFNAFFSTNQDELELVVHVSNFDMPHQGGITKPVKFGYMEQIQNETVFINTLQIVVATIFLLHAVYVLIMIFLFRRNKTSLFINYTLLLIATALSVLIDDAVVINLPIPFQLETRILFFLLFTTFFLSVRFILIQIDYQKAVVHRLFHILYWGMNLLAFALPFRLLIWPTISFVILAFITVCCLYGLLFKAVKQNHPDALLLLFFLTSYASNVTWGTLIKFYIVDIPFYPLDFIFTLLFIVLLAIRTHLRTINLVKEQSTKLIEADKLKDQFLAHTSHELKNPLHALINIAEVLKTEQGSELSHTQTKDINLLLQIAKHMHQTLEDLLDLSTLREKRLQLNINPVNLHAVITTVVDMLKYKINDKQTTIHIEVAHDFPLINGDEHRITQIFFNLIENALKYTQQGNIYISATLLKQSYVQVSIRDTGIGISEEALGRIFIPYDQGDQQSNRNNGLGLGLAICKNLIELHGGQITVESEKNTGTIFTFSLPISDSPAVSQSTFNQQISDEQLSTGQSNANEADNQGVILLVDDDIVNLKVFLAMLSNQYIIHTATSAEQALELIKNRHLDLVITDVTMPIMTGFQLTEKIRLEYSLSELPILLLTSRDRLADIQTGFQAGANDYMTKPVDGIELKARIATLIYLKRSVEQRLQTEAAWLQAQIQPHFLFNTLNTIASLSAIDHNRMLTLLDYFTIYLRKSFHFKNTEALVALTEELELVKAYLYIEQQRFPDRITVNWQINQQENIVVPPLSIQTLVENALRHGILRRPEGGTIEITIDELTDHYCISIKDNGVGMTNAQVEQIFAANIEKDKPGIGLHNTNKRLKALFNTALVIESEPDHGTMISFNVPKTHTTDVTGTETD
ncbi:Glycosyl hydrolases family 2, sugar binding domain [Amphibacillus marinus]|uniref:Circadian input-output histidine kinase CikA n=1 Tax=Amphibacillus marinus TaxID=872970 RepID=A0A1H8QQ61_9BACI|nr:ATP-binding protein [Amphibacillus marinus]SEO56138.1 Glycosyl hydrolases family 2, sugar binding domain [Amphibacillus marinus]